jgi:hypothetical protein
MVRHHNTTHNGLVHFQNTSHSAKVPTINSRALFSLDCALKDGQLDTINSRNATNSMAESNSVDATGRIGNSKNTIESWQDHKVPTAGLLQE